MSTTTTTYVEAFPAPPPTINSLDPEERSRLLRSTRKLGAVLGATPFLLDTQSSPNPSPKATRRVGRIFHSPTSSVSSIDSAEPDYVMVKSDTRSAPYQMQSIPPRTESPTPRPSSENKPNGRKRKGANGALPPIALVFDIPGSQTRSGTAAAPKGPPQPLLLRIRPALAGANSDSCIKPSGHPPRGHTSTLSPIASSFNMNLATPPTPTTPAPPSALNDREKRRKMAKLARTLGENIPPELVFRPPPPPARRASLFGRPRAEHVAPSPPALAVAATPVPPLRTASLENPPRPARKHRPRSLTLGSASAIAAATAALTRGTTSMDAPPAAVPREQPFVSGMTSINEPQPNESMEFEFGRRKEKEWSGEWNLRDMDDVAKRLRGLKGR